MGIAQAMLDNGRRREAQGQFKLFGGGRTSGFLWNSTVIRVIRERRISAKYLKRLVGVRGFEPPAPASRRQCSTIKSTAKSMG